MRAGGLVHNNKKWSFLKYGKEKKIAHHQIKMDKGVF